MHPDQMTGVYCKWRAYTCHILHPAWLLCFHTIFPCCNALYCQGRLSLFLFCRLQSAAQPFPGKPSIFFQWQNENQHSTSTAVVCVHPTVAQLQCLSTQCFAEIKSQRWKWAAVSDLARLWFIGPFRWLISPVFWGKLMSQCGRGAVITWRCRAGRHRGVMWSGNAPVCLLCLILFWAVFGGERDSHVTLFTSD